MEENQQPLFLKLETSMTSIPLFTKLKEYTFVGIFFFGKIAFIESGSFISIIRKKEERKGLCLLEACFYKLRMFSKFSDKHL